MNILLATFANMVMIYTSVCGQYPKSPEPEMDKVIAPFCRLERKELKDLNMKLTTLTLPSIFLTVSILLPGVVLAGDCEDKYPPEKIIKEQIIETPYEVTIKVPVQVAYWVTVKVPYNVAKSCTKRVKEEIKKKPWKILTVWNTIAFDCSYTAYKDVKEKKYKTEYRDKVEKRIKRTVKKLEEYKRPIEYTTCLAEKVGKGVVEAAIDYGEAYVDANESLVHLARGDKEGAKKALSRSKDSLHDSTRNIGKAGELAVKTTYDLSVGSSLNHTAKALDKVFRNDHKFENKYKESRQNVSREMRNSSKKVGVVLEAAGQPKNLARIGLLCVASYVAGPFGAAMVNVLYDKYVMKQSMTEGDMLKSFAIGAAAGYAAAGASAGISGYASAASSSITSNLATDAGEVILNGESYSSKDFFVSIASGLASVEAGDGIMSEIFESTIEGGLKSVATQSVENDLSLSKIDFDKVESSTYFGLANGITREGVNGLVEEMVIKNLPASWERKDLQIFDEMKEAIYQAFSAEQEAKIDKGIELYENLNKEKKEAVIEEAQKLGKNIADEAAMTAYGKKYSELTIRELASDKFKLVYNFTLENRMNDPESLASINTYFENSKYNLEEDQLRSPSNSAAALILAFIAGYGVYSTIIDSQVMISNAEAEGVTLAEYAKTHKIETALIASDILITLVPLAGNLLKVTSGSLHSAVKILASARKLGIGKNKLSKLIGTLREARHTKGMHGIGKASRKESTFLGKSFVGPNYKVASDGKTLVSADGLKQYRPPSYKSRIKKTQANFEWREVTNGKFKNNGHLDIID